MKCYMKNNASLSSIELIDIIMHCRMTLEGEKDLTTATMKLVQEIMVMTKDMLDMLKETINIVTHHQEQLTFLLNKDSNDGKSLSKERRHQLSKVKCYHCGRKHNEKDCPMVNNTCFRCQQYGHFVANCPLKGQLTPSQSELSSKSSGFKRPKHEELQLIHNERNKKTQKIGDSEYKINHHHSWNTSKSSIKRM